MRRALPFLLTTALAATAWGQDSDGDGIPDASDAFPCDASLASVIYAPSQSQWSLLAFEDQWPGDTDLDYNDVVVRVHQRFFRDAQGRTRRMNVLIDPVAVGGDANNGLALQIPASRTGVSARRRVGGGAWEPLGLEADQNTTLIVSPNLRELFAGASGAINSRTDRPVVSGQRIELELTFATPPTLNTGLAPFDVFIFRSGDFGHQIHLPSYGGTQAMNTALFGTGHDASSGSRFFIHHSGTPSALNLQNTARYPLEGVAIDELFPNIVPFATSAGLTHADFYLTSVVTSRGHAAGGVEVPSEPEPDRACIPQVSRLVPGNTTLIVERNGFRAQCRQWAGNLCQRMYIAIPQSAITQEAPCGVGDTTTLRPVWHGNVQQQCPQVCWMATGDPTCVQAITSAATGTDVGWMYSSSTVACDASGRRYSQVSVPTAGSLIWSFDSVTWQRSGSFSGYQCNW